MNAKTIEPTVEHFEYKTTNYKPRAEVKNFIEFAASKHYSEQDQATMALVRRTVDEMGNDPAIRFSMSITDESDADIQPAHAFKETYTAYNSLLDTRSHRIVSIMVVAGTVISGFSVKDSFTEIKANTCICNVAHPHLRSYRGSQVDSRVQFTSIEHQVQLLVSTLSDRVRFYRREDYTTGRLYLLGRPVDQDTNVAERFQIVIVLQVPVLKNGGTEVETFVAESV